MATLDPLDEDLVHEVKTKNIAAGKAITCQIKWKNDHPAAFETNISNTGSCVDLRAVHATRYIANGTTSGGASTDVDHPMSWDKGALINTNEMEIFAVIRAEYRFLDGGWEKKMSKKGAQGIDSLFYLDQMGTEYWAIVESKCTTNMADYKKYCKGGSPLARLGKAHPKIKGKKKSKPVAPNGVTQMTEPWVYHAFLQEGAGNPDDEVMDNLEELWGFLSAGNEAHKWMNVYGSETFHMVPGVYKSWAVVQGKGSKQPMEDIEIDWPDDYYRDEEFFALTTTTEDETTNDGLLSGTWHDLSDGFEKMCDKESKQIQAADLNAMKMEVDDLF